MDGYFKSITTHEHSPGKMGIARLCLDLILIFLYHILILCVSEESYFYIFAWVLPIITVIYILWDRFKWLEYRPVTSQINNRLVRLLISVVFNIAIVGQALVYSTIYTDFISLNFDTFILNVSFSVSSIIITLLYRKRKWLISEKSG